MFLVPKKYCDLLAVDFVPYGRATRMRSSLPTGCGLPRRKNAGFLPYGYGLPRETIVKIWKGFEF